MRVGRSSSNLRVAAMLLDLDSLEYSPAFNSLVAASAAASVGAPLEEWMSGMSSLFLPAALSMSMAAPRNFLPLGPEGTAAVRGLEGLPGLRLDTRPRLAACCLTCLAPFMVSALVSVFPTIAAPIRGMSMKPERSSTSKISSSKASEVDLSSMDCNHTAATLGLASHKNSTVLSTLSTKAFILFIPTNIRVVLASSRNTDLKNPSLTGPWTPASFCAPPNRKNSLPGIITCPVKFCIFSR